LTEEENKDKEKENKEEDKDKKEENKEENKDKKEEKSYPKWECSIDTGSCQ
jgi:hypothetical protein